MQNKAFDRLEKYTSRGYHFFCHLHEKFLNNEWGEEAHSLTKLLLLNNIDICLIVYKFWGMSITLLHICLTCYLNVVAWLNFKQRKLFCQAEQLPYLQEKKNHEIRGERWWVYWALTSSAPLLHSKINILMDISYIWGLGWLV